jgi:serine protease
MVLRSVIATVAVFALMGVMRLPVASAQDTPASRVIVKWKDESVSLAARSDVAVPIVQAAERPLGVATQSLRRLATGAEVLLLNPALAKADLSTFMASIRSSGQVEYIEEDIVVKAAAIPNDPLYSEQWAYFDPIAGMSMPAAWNITTGAGVDVAVVDSGYAPHSDLTANLVGGYDFIADPAQANDGDGRDGDPRDPGDADPTNPECAVSSWHGTLVSGTIAAVSNNAAGIAGTAFGARLVPVRVLGRCGSGFISDIADAVIWASGGSVPVVPENTHPARVINMSFSTRAVCPATLDAATRFAEDHGAVLVAAAGNGNGNGEPVFEYTPANCAAVMTTVALNRDGTKRSDSNRGGIVGAPGEALSTSNTGATAPGSETYASYAGTSAAAAHTSGVVALVVSRLPVFTRLQIESILRGTSRPYPLPCEGCGLGILDADAAVAALLVPPEPPSAFSGNPLTSTDGNYSVSWTPALLATHYEIERREGTGPWGANEIVTGTTRAWSGQSPNDYLHRIRACNANGCGNWKEGAAVKVIDLTLIPPRPASISAAPTTSFDGVYTVTWPAAARATYYIVQRQFGSTWAGSSTTNRTWQFANVPTATVQNRVQACNFNGCSDFRTGATVSVFRGPPARPTSITVTPTTSYDGNQTVSWPAVPGATKYVIERFRNAVFLSSSDLNAPYPQAPSIGFGGQPIGAYKHQVKACNPHGCSDWKVGSNYSVVPPLPPASITASPRVTQTRSYLVSWPASQHAHHYILQRANPTSWGSDITVSGTNRMFAGVPVGEYQHRVKACNDDGDCGAWRTGGHVTVCGLSGCE